MMKKLIACPVVLFILIIPVIARTGSFIRVNDAHFTKDGAACYYVGTNYWYGPTLALKDGDVSNKDRLKKELDFLRANGVTNLRILAATEGSGYENGVQRTEPATQPAKGVFTDAALIGLDYLLHEMGKRDMKAVLFLSNNWEWSGGFLQYINWNGLIPDSILVRKLTWDEQRDYTSSFYSCEACKADYLEQVAYILDRTNLYSGKKYTDDPAIMAWELANEPRPMRPAANDAFKQWISEAAAFIKSKDKNHLVTIGSEGLMGTEDMDLFKQIHADKNIDYLTIHIWPKNWGWFTDTAIGKSFESLLSKTNEYIQKHEVIARELNKPLVLEEFGLPRDKQSFAINTPTTFRDAYFQNILGKLENSEKNKGVIAGANFWAFGGKARPIPGQVYWKKGDDYMGDPPMEEQGLNSVFDGDSSTWKIIRSVAKAIAAVSPETAGLPADKMATQETVNLYRNLKLLLDKGVMFGHQDDLAYGVNWKYVPGNSDIKEVTNDYPAVYGWELGRLELDHAVNLDSVPFDKMKGFIRDVYSRGGVNTISWHLNNPLTGKTSWDPAEGTVASILPGGKKHELYKEWLDKIAAFLLDLKGKNGELIPVIFRPFHELNGNWFWWGEKYCTPEEYIQLYRFTESYLRDTKQVHSLLYAYNTDRFGSTEEFLRKYPGDEWTDIIGFDIYQRNKGPEAGAQFVQDAGNMLTMIETIAANRNKIPAVTEFGFGQVPDSTWWTGTLLKALNGHKISYVLGWRNAGAKPSGENEFYVPYKRHPSAKDFLRFYKDDKTLFQSDITKENLYR